MPEPIDLDREVLVGTYTSTLPHVVGTADGICSASFRDGRLSSVESAVITGDPSFLAVASDGCVYAVDEVGGELSAFAPDRSPLGRVSTGGAAPCHVALSPDERFVLVAHWGSGLVSVHERSTLDVVAEVRDGEHAHMAAFAPTDGSVLVPYLGSDVVVRYLLSDTGSLTPVGRWELPARTGPRHVAFDAAGRVHVVGELASTLTTFVDGRPASVVSTLPDTWSAENWAAAVRVADDRVYVTNRGNDSVAVFVLDPMPRLLAHVPCGGRTPRDLVVTPDGRHVLVANQDSDSIVVFGATSDGLRRVQRVAAPTPVCLVLR